MTKHNPAFRKTSAARFRARFGNEESCLEYLSGQKWKDGFVCRKCGHGNYCQGKTPFSRRCTKCKKEESVTAHTIFHRCHIPLTEALRMIYLVCANPKISSYELSRQLEIRQMTCWKLKTRLLECIEKKGDIDLLFREE